MRKLHTVDLLLVSVTLAILATSGCVSSPGAGTPDAPAPAQDRSAVRYPGDVLDLGSWYLTRPTGAPGDPDTVHQPGLATFSGPDFRLNETRDGVVFTANAGGATTENSDYPRSELREMSGSEKASWSNTSGTHTLSVRQAVTALPPAKPEVTTAQIHDASSDVLAVRLEATNLIVQYDDGNDDGGKTDITLDPAYQLGTPYDLKIVAANGRIEVYYNGTRKADIPKSGSEWYFKSGSYLQSNPSKGDAPDAAGEVVLFALRVTHAS